MLTPPVSRHACVCATEHIATFTTTKRISVGAESKSSFHTFRLNADKAGFIESIKDDTNNLSPGKEFCTLVDEPVMMAVESKKKPMKLPGHTKW